MPKEFDDMKEEIKNSNDNIKVKTIYNTMISYCSKCRKNTASKNPKVVRTENGRIILLSKCALCNSKKLKFFIEQEARGLLSNLRGIKIPILSDLPILKLYFESIK